MIYPASTRRLAPLSGAAIAAALILAASVGVVGHQTASAHNFVLDSSPAAGETVEESPLTIRITTNDNLLDLAGTGAGFAIVVQDVNGDYFGDGCVEVGTTDMAATVSLGLAGDYRVTYQYVSADGHPLSDSFTFTFAPALDHVPAMGVDEKPQCGVSGETLDTPVDETTPGDGGVAETGVVAEPTVEELIQNEVDEPGVITVAIAAVLIVISITLVVWMIRRSNRS